MTGLDTPASHQEWFIPHPLGARTLVIALCAVALLAFTGSRLEVDRMAAMTARSVLAPFGIAGEGPSANGIGNVVGALVPLAISERQEVSRIANFDPSALPPFAYLEQAIVTETALDPDTLRLEERTVVRTFLVRPYGYLATIALKTLETLEIALWGTLTAVILGLPLGLLCARNIMPLTVVRILARSAVSFLRAVPELISALFLVVAYGFGPIAGFLALGLHGAGVLGRFFSDEMEHADPRPQEALAAIGADRLAIWRVAVLPQVMPHHIGSTLYVLDRNVRMATVIGLVGAGGIGQELKGRYDMYEYGHVGTILLAIFLVVVLLDHISGRLRRKFL